MLKCIICFDNIKNQNKITLSCNHTFHYNCIKTMIMKRSRKCPLCRKKITWNIKTLMKQITTQNLRRSKRSKKKLKHKTL